MIQPGDDVLITVDLRVAPGTKVGIATVSVPNTEPLSVTLTVQRGITGLAGQAQGPLVADGQAHNIVITATPADPSVTNPGTITFTTATTPGVTFTTNKDCTVAEGGTTAECDLFGDNKLMLTATIGTDAPTGPLLIAGTELGQPALNVTGDLQIVARPAAALDLLNPVITQQPVAGGTARSPSPSRNTGGQPSTDGETVTIVLPDGFTPQQIRDWRSDLHHRGSRGTGGRRLCAPGDPTRGRRPDHGRPSSRPRNQGRHRDRQSSRTPTRCR